MKPMGWSRLLQGWPWFGGAGQYPITAYSEFLPPPRLGRKPSGAEDPFLFEPDDPWGWYVSEYQEALELRPGLSSVAAAVIHTLVHLGEGRSSHGLSHAKLVNNPAWPDELANAVGHLPHERYVLLLPLALSRTQDDKGRVRWTVFGASEQGPARPFWRGFFTAPDQEWPEEHSLGFIRRLLAAAFQEPLDTFADLKTAGFRILPQEEDSDDPLWSDGPLPRWTESYRLGKRALRGVKFLLTFRPFSRLPPAVRRAYLSGGLHLLPSPLSLVFWGAASYRALANELPLARQIPLLHVLGRHEGPRGLRVPQSGWLHEPRPGHELPANFHGPIRNTFKRTHRWGKVLRSQDELPLIEQEDRLSHVLFSTLPKDLGLYGKPMARNVQLWTHDNHLLLDGPNCSKADLERSLHAINQGGLFGYRFQYPAMQVGRHEVYWHRPLVAFADPAGGPPVVLTEAPLGCLTAYPCPPARASNGAKIQPIELWPRLRQRAAHLAAVEIFTPTAGPHPYQACVNVRKLLETRDLLGSSPLPRSLARRLLHCSKHESLDEFLAHLPEQANDRVRADELVEELSGGIEPGFALLPASLTYARTARRSWEVAYWKAIASLAEGGYLYKNNADCVRDAATQKHLVHHHRDLDPLGSYLLSYYTRIVAKADMTGQALVGDLPFRWQTEFPYVWMGGWQNNQHGDLHERDLIVVIPGRDRSRAVIMADHYDTAYMLDSYDPKFGGDGARLAAAGADDNHSATAALMLGAPVFLELSKAGRLDCDIWLIHLTGEEFPADCLGARHLTQGLIEGTLAMRRLDGGTHDLSTVKVQGLYVLDMIAHNNDHDQDVFQIAPGTGSQSMWLALQAHLAAEIWNEGTVRWNRRPTRKGKRRGRRSPRGAVVPGVFKHLALHGEVRPPYAPRSTLYNTDGQIFSDAGVPAVLFMENYDINRTGYHDTHDTMDNIDLDYGAAVAAITIESVARAATKKPLS
jgi:Peptidase family M28